MPVREERDFEKLRDVGFSKYERKERKVEFLEFRKRIGHVSGKRKYFGKSTGF